MTNGQQLVTGDPRIVLWKKTIATAVMAITSVLLVNLIDPLVQTYSWVWFRHVLLAICGNILLFEAKYWREWADKILSNGEN